jgi:hypothetical protein
MENARFSRQIGYVALYTRMRYTDLIPTTDSDVLARLERWFREQPEILVRIRVRRSGSEDFEFFSSFEALANRMRESLPGTWFAVFKQPQLPLRGVVDDSFIKGCMKHIHDGNEYLIVETVRRMAGKGSWLHNASGQTYAMLHGDLEESRGVPVAVGLYPPCLEERDDVVHVFTPNADGTVTAGPY